ncbi:MAG: FHA domain-containing protein, partial [Gemmatimonadales bacterium]
MQMPLNLFDTDTGKTHEFDLNEVRIGRDPSLEMVLAGDKSNVVSGSHARLLHENGEWWLEDLNSRNGTFIDSRRLKPREKVKLSGGEVVGLGERGPRLRVEISRPIVATLIEADLASMVPPQDPGVPDAATLMMDGDASPDAKTLMMEGAAPAPPPGLPPADKKPVAPVE